MADAHGPSAPLLRVAVGTAGLRPRPRRGGFAVAVEGRLPPSGDAGEERRGGLPRLASALRSGLRAGAVIALAWLATAPARAVRVPPAPGEGVALMVALDVSASMGEPGLGGSRKLDVAVAELERFLAGREGDAVGLVTFAREAVLRAPPSTDRRALGSALRSLAAGELGDGTAVGTALGLAANQMRALEARSRAIVLVSDGRSNAGALDPVTAARAAAGVGLKVYVLEVRGGAGEPARLEAVARAGNGRHFDVSEGGGVEEAWRSIDALEPGRLPGAPTTAEAPAAPWLLWWVAGCLVAERLAGASRWGRIP